ncbi:hypothetical protein RB623_04760 [Mesorhizobium sp. LHD-90]|uniref:hypothetical protein n=1 Tax=Mesorhizobium sp. LHD-90 TaxID=3071414 RepID=UPI0027DFD16E|nr:hypothetical protein [Mesorhizobium sp. LHD-90]MDQ6433358.1 hypothetical protein [Mesorhizobium sp. LHD-90]
MKFPIETFLFEQCPGTPRKFSRNVRIYGDPLHRKPSEISKLYGAMPLDQFLAEEARYGIGNYILVDETPTSCRIITSPGYCGGYGCVSDRGAFAATTLSPVLRAIGGGMQMNPFGLSFYLSYAPNSANGMMPFSTMFEGVFRLPPAAVIEFEAGTRTRYESYLVKGKELNPPRSFAAAMAEVSSAVARHFKANGKKPVVMFSGGVDSLAIYLGLREKMRPEDIHLITVDHNRANGPDRAFAVADKLGIEIDHVEDTYSSSPVANSILESQMEQDIVITRGPSVALLEKNLDGALILHGQNMDAISKVNMTVLQANLDRAYLSRAKMREIKSDDEKLRQYESFLGNLQFTNAYLSDPVFQKQTSAFFSRMHGEVADPQPGGRGIFRGMISSQIPNILSKPDYPLDQVPYLDAEVDIFERFIGIPDLDPSLGAKLIRYYTYAQISNKRLATFATPDGSKTVLVAMSGPILSYFIGRNLQLSDAAMPKGEVYAYAEKLAGMPYHQLATPTQRQFNMRKMNKYDGDALLMHNMDKLDVKKSFVVPRIKDKVARSHIEYIYRDVAKTARPDDPDVRLFSQSRGRHILNLEMLVRGALRNEAVEPMQGVRRQ